MPANITFSPGWFKYSLNGHKSFDHKSSKTRSQDSLSLYTWLLPRNKFRVSYGFILSNSPNSWGMDVAFTPQARSLSDSKRWRERPMAAIAKALQSAAQQVSWSSQMLKRTMDLFKSLLKKELGVYSRSSVTRVFLVRCQDVVYCTIYLSKMTRCS